MAIGSKIADASVVPEPRQRNTEDEKPAIKTGKSVKQIWRCKPNKAHQKDVDARWTVKVGDKVHHRLDGTLLDTSKNPMFTA